MFVQGRVKAVRKRQPSLLRLVSAHRLDERSERRKLVSCALPVAGTLILLL